MFQGRGIGAPGMRANDAKDDDATMKTEGRNIICKFFSQKVSLLTEFRMSAGTWSPLYMKSGSVSGGRSAITRVSSREMMYPPLQNRSVKRRDEATVHTDSSGVAPMADLVCGRSMWLLSIETKVMPSDISCAALRGDDSLHVYLENAASKKSGKKERGLKSEQGTGGGSRT
jgi:hypothetical protein